MQFNEKYLINEDCNDLMSIWTKMADMSNYRWRYVDRNVGSSVRLLWIMDVLLACFLLVTYAPHGRSAIGGTYIKADAAGHLMAALSRTYTALSSSHSLTLA